MNDNPSNHAPITDATLADTADTSADPGTADQLASLEGVGGALHTRWGYLAAETLSGLRRNAAMTVAAVVTSLVSLALLGAGLLLQIQVGLIEDLFADQVEVTVFLRDDISDHQLETLRGRLADDARVAEVRYESKQQALRNFRKIFADDELLNDNVTADELPASFRLTPADAEDYRRLQDDYAAAPGVEAVNDQTQVLERVFSIMRTVRNGALGAALLQLVAAAVLVFNTVRMTAYARRDQTRIMKLVGATNAYIRLPFVAEGVVTGLVGAGLAVAALSLAYDKVVAQFATQIQFLPIIEASAVWTVAPVLVAVGVGLSVAAAFVSLRRHLRV